MNTKTTQPREQASPDTLWRIKFPDGAVAVIDSEPADYMQPYATAYRIATVAAPEAPILPPEGFIDFSGIPAECALQVEVAAKLCDRNDYLTCADTLRAIAGKMRASTGAAPLVPEVAASAPIDITWAWGSSNGTGLYGALPAAATAASASGEAVAEWVNEEQGFQYLIPGRLPDGTKLCRATAPSRNAAPLDQEAFEAQARYQGATDFEPSGVGMVCENGWFPATYRDPMTELARRVWANKSDRAALTQQSAAQADWKARSERAEAALALSEQFRMKDGLSHAVERAAQASHAGAAEMPLYTCKGKGGEYELIGVAYGAGRSRGQLINLYRETASGVRYFRMPDDFAERMECIERAAMSAAIEQKEKP